VDLNCFYNDVILRHGDTQHDDTLYNGIQQNDTQHNGIRHNDKKCDTQHNYNLHNNKKLRHSAQQLENAIQQHTQH
jgi:hypothetical protein